ncbi:MAG: hypothetical protein IPP88_16575 [Betaproteobacteria bacterium]|nr:hypothetical protein [Betaproteobacteria bacterium]
MRHKLFYTIALSGFLAAIWLKFFAHGWLRGNAYDVLLVAFLSSATFGIRNLALIQSVGHNTAAETLRQSQIALNRKISAAWAIIACSAELMQGIMKMATGKHALGTFDPVDLACYVFGAILSLNVNRLLYVVQQNK